MNSLPQTPRALSHPTEPVFVLDDAIVQAAIAASRNHPRRRIMQPIQRSSEAHVQRLLNVMQPGSYVQPHLHPRSQAVELVCPIQGSVRVFIFDETGRVVKKIPLAAGQAPALADIEPHIWHTFTATSPDTVVLEIKGGPYDALRDKIFAKWAPSETDPGAAAYLEKLMAP